MSTSDPNDVPARPVQELTVLDSLAQVDGQTSERLNRLMAYTRLKGWRVVNGTDPTRPYVIIDGPDRRVHLMFDSRETRWSAAFLTLPIRGGAAGNTANRAVPSDRLAEVVEAMTVFLLGEVLTVER